MEVGTQSPELAKKRFRIMTIAGSLKGTLGAVSRAYWGFYPTFKRIVERNPPGFLGVTLSEKTPGMFRTLRANLRTYRGKP